MTCLTFIRVYVESRVRIPIVLQKRPWAPPPPQKKGGVLGRQVEDMTNLEILDEPLEERYEVLCPPNVPRDGLFQKVFWKCWSCGGGTVSVKKTRRMRGRPERAHRGWP